MMIFTHMIFFNFFTGAGDAVPPAAVTARYRGFHMNTGRMMGA